MIRQGLFTLAEARWLGPLVAAGVVLAVIYLLLATRELLAEWVRDRRAARQAAEEDAGAAVAEMTPQPEPATQRPGRHSGEFRAVAPAPPRRGKPTAGDGVGFPHPPGPQAVPDRFASPQEMADFHRDAGLDIFPERQP